MVVDGVQCGIQIPLGDHVVQMAMMGIVLGDPFWQANPASDLYKPSGPLHRKPPSRARNDTAKAAAQLKQDDEEALR